MNLYQRLLAITEEVGKIEKTGKNSQQGYAFTEHSEVVSTLKPLLVKHGVMVIAETRGRTLQQVTNAKGTVFTQASVCSRYTLINADKPEERMECDWDAGEALDTSDKATNKATTASQKTFLMKLFHISDKDDPDNDSPQTGQVQKPQASTVLDMAQVAKLMSLAKMKGAKDRDEAVSFINGALLTQDFTKLDPSKFDEYKAVISDPKVVYKPTEELPF